MTTIAPVSDIRSSAHGLLMLNRTRRFLIPNVDFARIVEDSGAYNIIYCGGFGKIHWEIAERLAYILSDFCRCITLELE